MQLLVLHFVGDLKAHISVFDHAPATTSDKLQSVGAFAKSDL